MTAAVPTRHARLLAWVEEFRALCQPDAVVWCDGSQEENERLCAAMVASGTAVRLATIAAQSRSFSSCEPSHQTTASG